MRRHAFRGLAALLALTLLLFGGQLLFAGWASAEHAIHELSWGVIEGLLMVVPLAVLIRRPERVDAMQVLLAATAALLATMPLVGFDAFTLVLAGLVGILVALHPARGDLMDLGLRSRPALVAAGLGAAALAVWALDQAALQRGAGDEHAALDHYTGVAAAALGIAFVLLAAVVVRASRLALWCAGLGAVILGVASAAFADQVSSLGVAGGLVLVAGGAGAVLAAEARARRAVAAPATA